MAVADNRQRRMPLPDDRSPRRSSPLAYPEAVLIVHPVESEFKGEVHFFGFIFPLGFSYLFNKFIWYCY